MFVKLKSTKLILFVFFLVVSINFSLAQSNFKTQWLFPSATTSISFRSLTTGTVNYTWSCTPSGNSGTGSFTQNSYGVTTLTGLNIPASNTVTIQMQPANLKRFVATVNSTTSNTTLRNVTQWGTVNWTSMEEAFQKCQNLNITATDVPNLNLVNNMNSMFISCFNLNGPANIGTWNTANVTTMTDLFSYASVFNQNIGNWNTSNVTNMKGMFRGAAAFNQNIGNWNTANVTNMNLMFTQTNAFNQPIGSWNTGNVTNMANMFDDANAFNQSLNTWNTINVTNMSYMFQSANVFNQTIGAWNTSNVASMGGMFKQAPVFNQPIGNWNTGNVTIMAEMFNGASAFNQPIGTWNTMNVTNMESMFSSTSAFNKPLGTWNTGSVTDMSYMFSQASAFNQTVGTWNTANVIEMNSMFSNATAFNQTIGNWNTGDVTIMHYMFSGASAFNQPIGNWNTSNVTSMAGMFRNASAFNQNIGNWNTINVTDMSSMFNGASAFNQNIGSWNTSNVTLMQSIFENAPAFNQNIGSWNTSNVIFMQSMFKGAFAFNQNIATWNTSSALLMSSMFENAHAFNQNIGSWILTSNISLTSMLNNCGMDCYNYSLTLNGWAANNPSVTGRSLGAVGRQYGTNAATSRATLVSTRSWIISGDTPSGVVCYHPANFVTEWVFPSTTTSISFRSLTTGTVNYTWSCSPSGNSGSGSFTQTTYGLTTLSGLNIPAGNTITLQMNGTNLKRIVANTGFASPMTTLKKVTQWGTGNWTTMQDAFRNCASLNVTAVDIPNLNAVSDMSFMFYGCSSLTGPANIGFWNTSNVTNMSALFQNATLFNQNTGAWNTGNVVSMTGMFQKASAFNQNIGNWNTANVTSMVGMFNGASVFNQNIGNWNTANVTNMGMMFMNAYVFNQDITNWNTANVNNMSDMFNAAVSFNQDIDDWQTANVVNMAQMFLKASAFNQDIDTWILKSNVNLTSMLNGCGMDCSNYSSTLMGWQANNPTVIGRNLGAVGRVYGTNAVSARTTLTSVRNWTITGDIAGASACDPYFRLANNSVGIADNVMENVNVYPNPTSGVFTIERIVSVDDNVRMNVVNMLGQVVYQDKLFSNKQLIDLSNLNEGVYILNILSDNQNKAIRLIIEK